MLICIATGFTSGLPLYLLLNLVPAWLTTQGLSLKLIGAMALIQFPYTWKFIWSPLLDRFTLPLLGRRRGWMLATQLVLLVAIAGLGQIPIAELAQNAPVKGMPQDSWVNLSHFAPLFALTGLIAFFSATQDIVLDAYRRELLPEAELGLGNAFHVNAYRIAGLIPGAVSLILADHLPWNTVFLITALFMLPGVVVTLVVSEPVIRATPPRGLREAVVEPFREFFGRHGVRAALLILAFILLYKLGDSLCTALATTFYLKMGFSMSDVGWIAKNAGLWPSVAGGILGGLWMVKLGINRALWVFGVFQWIAILGFAVLAFLGPAQPDFARRIVLALVIGTEAVGVGLGTTAFVAYMARTTHPAYTATQLALFTSLMAVPRTFINACAGWLVEGGPLPLGPLGDYTFAGLGWFHFFLLCAVLAIPGMLLLLRVAPWTAPTSTERNT